MPATRGGALGVFRELDAGAARMDVIPWIGDAGYLDDEGLGVLPRGRLAGAQRRTILEGRQAWRPALRLAFGRPEGLDPGTRVGDRREEVTP